MLSHKIWGGFSLYSHPGRGVDIFLACHARSIAFYKISVLEINKKAVLSQRWPRNAPYRPTWPIGPWKFSGIPDYAHGYYSQHFYELLFWSTLWMFLQNLKCVALSVPEIIGGTQKIGHSPDTPTLPLKSVALPVPEIVGGTPQKLGSLRIRPR